MTRLESAREFWEGDVEGTAIVRTYGKHGTKGRTAKKQLPSRTAARYALNLFELKWRLGFIQDARVIADRSKRVKEVIKRLFKSPNLSALVVHLLEDLLQLRSARFLESLSIESVGGREMSAVFELLAQKAPPTLKRIQVPLTPYLGAALGVLKDVDDTRGAELGYSIGEYADAGLELGKQPLALEHLEALLIEPPIAVPGLSIIAESTMPKLEKIDLNCAARNSDVDQLKGLFDIARHPSLKALHLKGARFARDVVKNLIGTPMLAQLEWLDLSYGVLDDANAMAIAARKSELPKLKRFTVHRCGLTRAGLERLRETGLEIDLPPVPVDDSITRERVRALCEDERQESNARELAQVKLWTEIGRDRFRMWGRVYAGRVYKVVVHLPQLNASCDCPSRKQPCKHSLALMFLAADDPVPEAKKPSWIY